MRILGIDPSLSRTGTALIDDGHIELYTIPTKPTDGDLESRFARLGGILTRLPMVTDVDLVVVEGPQLGRAEAGTFERAGLWWLIISRYLGDFDRTGLTGNVCVVEPLRLKRYVTGRGATRGPNKVEKGEIISKLSRELDVLIRDDNEADALACALIGARIAGEPLDQTYKYREDVVAEICKESSKDA